MHGKETNAVIWWICCRNLPAEGRWDYGLYSPIPCFGYGECGWLLHTQVVRPEW